MSPYSSAEDEYDSDEPPELHLNLDKLIRRATKILNTPCKRARRLTRGARHEIFVLEFEETHTLFASLARAGYSCIARFARVKGHTVKERSETATIRYLKQQTSIPVPEIYYEDLDPDNDVGAAFVLMERLPGRHLYKIWDGLSLDHKKVVLSEIAPVVCQFGALRFDKIGCLTDSGIGPLVSPCYSSPQGPFDSVLDYLHSFVRPDAVESLQLSRLFKEVQAELAAFVCQNDTSYLKQPFSLIHADFDAQNMLFVDSPDGSGLKLSGLIDFEFSHTGPLYFLYEYPIFIQDVSWSKHLYAENATLRAYFVSQIFSRLPSLEQQKVFISCMNSKTFLLNGFRDAFMTVTCSEDTRIHSATRYLESLRDGTGLAYSGRVDYRPEFYTESAKIPAWTNVLLPPSTSWSVGSVILPQGHDT
ncbi:kinase-like domain-containing protein [Stachybotrys elegans]|uniref:Kinase-like domain-containing protein n=1 Tax=Stachybotrys elegans TaxID=80388 RepID=A0A8K0SQ92_9HYPO|nr:kinase-like domain-containing protein [Stachybotrys elegans]